MTGDRVAIRPDRVGHIQDKVIVGFRVSHFERIRHIGQVAGTAARVDIEGINGIAGIIDVVGRIQNVEKCNGGSAGKRRKHKFVKNTACVYFRYFSRIENLDFEINDDE